MALGDQAVKDAHGGGLPLIPQPCHHPPSWMSPVGLVSYYARRVQGKGGEAQPLAGDSTPRKGAEGQEGCKRNQDPKAVAVLTRDSSLASSWRAKARVLSHACCPGIPGHEAQGPSQQGGQGCRLFLARRRHGENCRTLCRGLPHIS